MRLPRLDRRHAALAGVLVAFGLISVAIRGVDVGGEDDKEGVPSVEHRGTAGLRALYLACGSLGLPVGTCHRFPADLDGDVAALVVIGGRMEAPADRAALTEWVERGGRLLVGDAARPVEGGNAGNFARILPLSAPSGTRPGEGASGWDLHADAPRASRCLDPESLPRGARVIVRAGGEEENRPWIASWPVGSGEVTVLAEADFLTNAGLESPGAGVLAVRLVENLASGRRVDFLESIHGYAESPSMFGGPARMIFTTTAGHLTVQLGAAALLLLLGGVPRFGRVRRVLLPPRRSGEEHVDAVAGLLVAAGAWEEVGKLCLLGLRRRLGLPPAAAGAAVARDLVAHLAWDDRSRAEELKEALWKIRRGTDPASMIPALDLVEERATPAFRGARGPLKDRRGG